MSDIPQFESDTVEFKTQWAESAKEALSAFLNSSGGTIYFGVSDTGDVIGLNKEQVDEVQRNVAVVTRQGFRPAADSFVRTRVLAEKDRSVVEVSVLAGSEPPYYTTIREKGSRAYIRRGPACFEITDAERRELIRRSDTRSWDELPAREQELTFNATKAYFDSQAMEFSERKYGLLGMTDARGFYTNLAFLVSDQCTVQTRIGWFDGTDRGSTAHKIVTLKGSVLTQLDEAMKLLLAPDVIKAFTIGDDGRRKTKEDFPRVAVREALVNAFAHRDYSTGLQAFVSVFSNRMEFFTYGGLPKGVLESQLEEGASACRNEKVVDLLIRFDLMERYGLGIPNMFAAYRPYSLRPEIKVDPNRILIVLPRLPQTDNSRLSDDENVVCGLLSQHGVLPRSAIQKSTGWSVSKTTILLNQLMVQNVIERVGAGRNTVYRLKAGSGQAK